MLGCIYENEIRGKKGNVSLGYYKKKGNKK